MDREIKEELERHKAAKIELVRRELAWESEKQRVALEKLRKRWVTLLTFLVLIYVLFYGVALMILFLAHLIFLFLSLNQLPISNPMS